MIDIWMIFTMIIPLLEVSLHTYKEMIRIKLANFESPSKVLNQSHGKIHLYQSWVNDDENKRLGFKHIITNLSSDLSSLRGSNGARMCLISSCQAYL